MNYSQNDSVLRIFIQGGLADQFSVFKTCNDCFGPSSLHGTWLNKKYFGKGSMEPVTDLNQFSFLHIDESRAGILKGIETDIVFVVEGYIRGLTSDGKVALHNTGAILKRCPDDTNEERGVFPITVTIKINSTGEIIARYAAVWSD